MPPHGRTNSGDLAALFVDSLPLIQRILRAITLRHRLSSQEAEEFESLAREKLIEHDYAVLASFEGRSTLGTWLSVVLVNLFRDHCNEIWGRWRPSKTARRLGAVATQLEILIQRDGHSVREALAVMRSRDSALDEQALRRLVAQLPHRDRVRELGLDQVPTAELTTNPDVVSDALEESEQAAARATLKQTLEGLPAEDQLILRMRYWDGLPIAQIARMLQLAQAPLYPRLKALHAELRKRLDRAGLDDRLVSEYFGSDPGAGRRV